VRLEEVGAGVDSRPLTVPGAEPTGDVVASAA
jgi:hypothetical protein